VCELGLLLKNGRLFLRLLDMKGQRLKQGGWLKFVELLLHSLEVLIGISLDG
jgi:hypothetical protein